MQFNQTNNNKGDVNNAIAENGNVVQAVGDNNTQKVVQEKPSFWARLWKRIVAWWKGTP